MLLAPAPPAGAHAAVVASTPPSGAVLGSSPEAVTVTFSEPVSAVPGRVRVIAPDGERIDRGEETVRGTTLRIPLRRADRPLGTYLVSYRLISADSHPVAGGYSFSVGAPSATAPERQEGSAHPSVRIAVPVVRYLGYAGLVLLVGPALLLARLWPRRLPRRGAILLARTGLGLIAAATLAGLALQVPYAAGAPAYEISAAGLWQVLGTDFGLVLLARLAVLALVAAVLPPVLRGRSGRWRATALVLLALAGLSTWPLAGHPVASPLPPVSVLADVVHLAAMSAWLGGLVALLAFPLRAAHPRVLARILPVWSRWATIAVIWLAVGGAAQALIEVGAVGPLFGTGYGRLLLAKVALLAAVLGAAAYARRLAIRRAGPTPPYHAGPTPPDRSRRRLRRTVGVEVAGTALVLALSAVLVQTPPARTVRAGTVAAAPAGFAQTLTCPLYTLQFDIYPVQLGENNTVHAYVYRADGSPLAAREWTLTSALPAKGIEPVRTPLLGLQPHHAIGSVTFPVPGEWQLRFTIRTSEIDQATVATTVRVR
ncbi:copper resistance protein CopC [Micromonospora sp. NPDC049559]|uniref:copper resistance CopC/CopD family protein n=1 Tax=Micromonospora sp. NPDC049559 TaxID=3155923 RepID=UPI003424DD9C